MRWSKPMDGEVRIVKKFALLPIEAINGDVAWLETVYVKQKYVSGLYYSGWVDMAFATQEEYEEYKNAHEG